MKVKLGKKFYVNIIEHRGFIELQRVISLLNEISYKVVMNDITNDEEIKKIIEEYFSKYHMFCGSPYKKFSIANKYRSKYCDGETEDTFKIKISGKYLHYFDLGRDYICYITDCSYKKKSWERIRVNLSPRLLKLIFQVEVKDKA